MKKLMLCALTVAAFCIPVMAADAPTPEMKAAIEKPMTMDKAKDVKKHVVFNHSSHSKIECAYCHHKATSDGKVYVSCSVNSECHDIMDRKDKSEHSYYQAMHNKKAEKSCMGCHAKLAKENPELKETFKGCKPCHS